jgi:hypothetical protein
MEVEGTVRGSLVIQVQLLSSGRAVKVAQQAVNAMHMLTRANASKKEERGDAEDAHSKLEGAK